MRRPVGVPFQRDGGHGDDRPVGQPLFQGVVLRLAFGQAEAPAVVVDHDVDVIRVVEGRRGTLERGRAGVDDVGGVAHGVLDFRTRIKT